MPWYDAPNETPEQKRRRLHLMATLGGCLAPKGTYGLASPEQLRRAKAERKHWSRRARVVWALYWTALLALFAVGITGLALGHAWLVVVAVGAELAVLMGGIAIGIRNELRHSRRRAERRTE